MDITNENYLPDLSEINIPAPVVIVISDDLSVSLEGPTHVSSPTSDTQIFEFPNLSPFHLMIDECVIIADSDPTKE